MQWHYRWVLVVVGLALLLGASTYQLSWLWELEETAVDAYYRLRGPEPPPADLVLVAIDAESLAELGPWPWPEERLEQLYRTLEDAGAGLVVSTIPGDPGSSGKRLMAHAR